MNDKTSENPTAKGLTGTYIFSVETSAPFKKFFGKLEIHWSINGTLITFKTVRYLIDKTTNFGGNSADINITLNGSPPKTIAKGNCIQNAAWNSWPTTTTTGLVSGKLHAKVEFIFDVSGGSDPKVYTELSISQ